MKGKSVYRVVAEFRSNLSAVPFVLRGLPWSSRAAFFEAPGAMMAF